MIQTGSTTGTATISDGTLSAHLVIVKGARLGARKWVRSPGRPRGDRRDEA